VQPIQKIEGERQRDKRDKQWQRKNGAGHLPATQA